jgi:hypothetical protein
MRCTWKFAALLVVIPFALGLMVNSASCQEKQEDFWQLVETVKDILAGKNIEHAKGAIAEGARLVYGVQFEDLRSVVAGEVKTCSLGDESYQGVMISAKTNASEDAGYIVLKTVKSDNSKVRFHTVVFMKDSLGQYKIHSWHTGDGGQ